MDDKERVLTLASASRMTGVEQKKLQSMIDEGKLEAVKTEGGNLLISESSLKLILEESQIIETSHSENSLSEDECNQIINTALNDWDQRESMIQRDKDGKIEQNFEEDLDYRNTTLFIPNKPDEWLFGKIMGAIQTFNNSEQGYGFDVHGLAEPPNVMRYQAPDVHPKGKPGKYDWHMDVTPSNQTRKISAVVLSLIHI